MQNRFSLLAATAMAAGTLAFLGYDSSLLAQQDATRQGTPGSSTLSGQTSTPGSSLNASARMNVPQGITVSQMADRQGVQRTLGQVVETALQENGLNQLGSHFASSDRMRLNNLQQQANQYQQKLQQFRQAWKQKYNADFDLREEVVFGEQWRGFEVVQGEVTNPALLSNWPVQSSGSGSLTPSTPGGTNTDPNIRPNTDFRLDTRTDTTRTDTTIRTTPSGGAAQDRATVSTPGSPGTSVTPGGPTGIGGSTSAGGTSASGSVGTSAADRPTASSPGSPSTPTPGASGTAPGGISASGQASGTGLSGSASTSSGLGASGQASSSSGISASGQPSSSGLGASGQAPGIGARSMIDRGSQVAIVTLPASHGAPEVNVSLVRESGMSGAGGAGAGARSSLDTSGSGAGISGSASVGGAGAGASAGTSGSNRATTSTPGSPSSPSGTGTGTAGVSGSAGAGSSGISGSANVGAPGAGAGAPGAAMAGAGTWRIDIPDSIDANKLAQNLDKHLKMVLDQQAQWPADQVEAQRMVSHHLLAAFYDTGMMGGGANLRGGANIQGGTNTDNTIRSDTTIRSSETARPGTGAPADRAEPGRPGEPRNELTPNQPGQGTGTGQSNTTPRRDN